MAAKTLKELPRKNIITMLFESSEHKHVTTFPFIKFTYICLNQATANQISAISSNSKNEGTADIGSPQRNIIKPLPKRKRNTKNPNTITGSYMMKHSKRHLSAEIRNTSAFL